MLKKIYYSRPVRSINERSPVVRSIVSTMKGIYCGTGDPMRKKIYWRIYSIINYFRLGSGLLKKRHIKRMSLPIDAEIIYISPDRIEYVLLPYKSRYENAEPVENGNWDLRTEKLENSDIFMALKEHFTGGVPLSSTRYYADTLEQIQKGGIMWGCQTKDELDDKCRKIDELYTNIRDAGYKTRDESGGAALTGEVKVRVDRNGKFLLEDGVSRVAIAQALGIQSIPVMVTKRHYQWARFRKEVYLYSQEQPKGAYQQVIHPDFQNIRFQRSDDRWELISKNLPLTSGSVLDIGSNWGYFCHKFEDLGFDCYAVENNYRWLYFLRKFKAIENRKFEIIPRSVFDIERKNYDIVLALSIFHHFLRSRDLYDRLTRLLGELDMKAMYFEPHQTGQGHKGAYIDYDEDEFASYIIKNSCLSQHKLLGRNERGRNLYLLT